MEFSRLCALAQIHNAELVVAVRAEDPIEEISARFERVTQIGNAIMAYSPADERELDEMMIYFARRAATTANHTAARRDYEKVSALLTASGADLPKGDRDPRQHIQEGPFVARDTDPEALAERVVHEAGRLSLIGPDYRIMAASWGDALFHGRRPAQMAGLHLGEILGHRQFERSFRPKLQHLFTDGSEIDYTHRATVSHRRQRMVQIQCWPVLDARGRTILAALHSVEAVQRPSRS